MSEAPNTTPSSPVSIIDNTSMDETAQLQGKTMMGAVQTPEEYNNSLKKLFVDIDMFTMMPHYSKPSNEQASTTTPTQATQARGMQSTTNLTSPLEQQTIYKNIEGNLLLRKQTVLKLFDVASIPFNVRFEMCPHQILNITKEKVVQNQWSNRSARYHNTFAQGSPRSIIKVFITPTTYYHSPQWNWVVPIPLDCQAAHNTRTALHRCDLCPTQYQLHLAPHQTPGVVTKLVFLTCWKWLADGKTPAIYNSHLPPSTAETFGVVVDKSERVAAMFQGDTVVENDSLLVPESLARLFA